MTTRPAGWYPDPEGNQRYFDGQRWLDVPPPPPITPVPVTAPPQILASGPNHPLHLVLTLLTCGLWLPIWLLVALGNKRTYRTVDPDGTVRVLRNPRDTTERYLAIGIVVALVVAVAGHNHPAVVVFIIFAGMLTFGVWYAIKWSDAKDVEEAQRRGDNDQ